MRLRGFSPGCQPMDGFIERRDATHKFDEGTRRYLDEIVYSRPLSGNEIKMYELDFIEREHDGFVDTGSCAVRERFDNLKAMHTLITSANDEGVYEQWIYIIPDQADDDDIMDVAMDQPDTYSEACGLFIRLMRSKMMREGGLYIGGEVYSQDD